MKKILICVVLFLPVVLPFQAFAQEEGVCCVLVDDHPLCVINISESTCTYELYGVWHADVTCDDNPCGTGIPAMTEWGMIIFAVLSGLGIIYFLKKQRRAGN